jgi:hypothetical protein
VTAEPRPKAVRVAAAVTAVALAFALPVLLVLASVVSDDWRPLVNGLLTVSILGPIVVWFVLLARRRREQFPPPESPPEP